MCIRDRHTGKRSIAGAFAQAVNGSMQSLATAKYGGKHIAHGKVIVIVGIDVYKRQSTISSETIDCKSVLLKSLKESLQRVLRLHVMVPSVTNLVSRSNSDLVLN